MFQNARTIKIFVELLDEGTPTMRGTQAIDLGNGLYEVLPTPDYDPEDEVWEFLPGSVVMLEKRVGYPGEYLLAVAKHE